MDGKDRELEDRTIKHPERARMIAALWHSSEPLSPRCYVEDFRDGGSLSNVSYHLGILEHAGVVSRARDHEQDCQRFYVLGGPNASEAVRRLGLTNGSTG